MFLQHLVDQIRQQYNTAQRNPVVQQLEQALRENSSQGHPGFGGNMMHQPNRMPSTPLTQQMGGMMFPAQPGTQYEDQSLTMGSQGPTPLTSMVGRLNGQVPQMGFGMQVQNIGQMPQQIQGPSYFDHFQSQGHMNPQVSDNGYYWY